MEKTKIRLLQTVPSIQIDSITGTAQNEVQKMNLFCLNKIEITQVVTREYEGLSEFWSDDDTEDGPMKLTISVEPQLVQSVA